MAQNVILWSSGDGARSRGKYSPWNTWAAAREKFWDAELAEDKGPAADGRGVLWEIGPPAQKALSP